MKIVDTYTTTRYMSTRKGGMGETQRYKMGQVAELYAPALQPNDWYLVIVWGVFEDGSEIELSKIVVKR